MIGRWNNNDGGPLWARPLGVARRQPRRIVRVLEVLMWDVGKPRKLSRGGGATRVILDGEVYGLSGRRSDPLNGVQAESPTGGGGEEAAPVLVLDERVDVEGPRGRQVVRMNPNQRRDLLVQPIPAGEELQGIPERGSGIHHDQANERLVVNSAADVLPEAFGGLRRNEVREELVRDEVALRQLETVGKRLGFKASARMLVQPSKDPAMGLAPRDVRPLAQGGEGVGRRQARGHSLLGVVFLEPSRAQGA